MARGKRDFGKFLVEGLEEEAVNQVGAVPSAAESILKSRQNALGAIASGKRVMDVTEWVSPDRCKPWAHFNRDLDYLNEERCSDLIESFLAAKRQRIPAIVRRIKDDPDFDYEIISGVRRWWTVKWLREHHHPEFEYLVTVQNIGDEEAFVVSDLENRARKDLTDWERAKEYARALDLFYNSNQSEMAQHLRVSNAWLSRLLDVARLPRDIVNAFESQHDLTTAMARGLKPMCRDRSALERMVAESLNIQAERAAAATTLAPADIFKRLQAAGRDERKNVVAAPIKGSFKSATGKIMMSYSKAASGALKLEVPAGSGATSAELIEVFRKLISEPL